ncbi:hypothetical protein CBW46_011510 [Paenibacillus xerothermodurans]|uniref:Uncharacterized protein n=1 Tax=Paenibacillus xerothermodurans TaxID=1977292 RepID=A0A2W1NAV9_PAEXE|nr:hypothetical protein CBW46_011510 [Paenibacillus xerothermodurans]
MISPFRVGTTCCLVELTVKEAMALGSGVSFGAQPLLAAQARRKLRTALEELLIPESPRAQFDMLDA